MMRWNAENDAINGEIKPWLMEINIKAAQDEIAALVLESGLSAEELASAANGGNEMIMY
jgi:hypothetical protein